MATPQTFLTLGQAAKAVNKGKGTISKAIKSGRLSIAEKIGSTYKIDPAELFRVFPISIEETKETVEAERLETHKETQGNRELELRLEHALELLRMERDGHAETKAEKARMLDMLENQTRLLAHMKEESARKPLEMPVEAQRGFWATLMGKKA